MDTSAKTESINEVMQNLEKKSVILPEFQRDFVWEIEKTYDLFDSLVKDIFIGSVIYGVPSFEITTRMIDDRPRKGPGRRKKLEIKSYNKEDIKKNVQTNGFRLLLDGQQRLTSIYRALNDIDKVWFIAKSPSELDNNEDFNKSTLEQILFKFSGQESPDRLSIKLSDAYKAMQNNYREEKQKQEFFKVLKYPQAFGKTKEDEDGIFSNYLTITNKLQDLFKSQKLLSYYLLDTTLEKFALFFERSNSKGIQLSFIDILAAKLYKGFNLKEKITEFNDEYPDYSLNEEILVRTISFMISNGKNIERTYILGNLTDKHFTEHWKHVCDLYRKTIDFLFKNHMILSLSWMPYENMLIPLMMFLREMKGQFSQMTERQIKFIRLWYWASIFAQRYTSSSNESIIQDASILSQIAKGKEIPDKNYFWKLRSQVNSAEELNSYTKKGSVIYRGIFNLLNYHSKGLKDWKNTSNLSFNHSTLEDHHIFPQQYLKSEANSHKDENISFMDSVVNKALIPKLTNIKIGKKSPSEYLKELKKDNPNLSQSLDNHLIPPELIEGKYDINYMGFLKKRAEDIFKVIKENVISPIEEILNPRTGKEYSEAGQ